MEQDEALSDGSALLKPNGANGTNGVNRAPKLATAERLEVATSDHDESPPDGAFSEPSPSSRSAALSYPEFVVALKGALREFSRPDLLSQNPLLHSRLLGADGSIGPAKLQTLLSETVKDLFSSPKDEKFRRVIELTYFRPAPKQEAAADRLSLAFSTYRRHLTAAISRLARWLWERELAAAVQDARSDATETLSEAAHLKASPAHAHVSIVVLPFINLGCGEEQEYFVDGITESLTTDLSRIPGAFVIARNTAFFYKGKSVNARQIASELGVRYVMEGSVQRSDSRIRVNAQLIDAETGAHLWAERFDKPRAELFEMQDEIVARLARTLDEKLALAEARRAERSRIADPDALDYFFRGWTAFNRGHNCDNLIEAEGFFNHALAIDPTNVDALVGLAMAKYAFAAIYATEDRVAYFRAAEQAAVKALTLSPDHPRAHSALAYVYITTNRAELGIAEAERALQLDQNLAPCHAAIGWGKMMLGHAEETEKYINKALRLSPLDSFASIWCTMAGASTLVLGRLDDAIVWLRRAIGANQSYAMAHLILAAALALQGRRDEARAPAAAGRALAPTFTVRRFRTRVLSDNPIYLAQRERLYEGMRLAGVPDEESDAMPHATKSTADHDSRRAKKASLGSHSPE